MSPTTDPIEETDKDLGAAIHRLQESKTWRENEDLKLGKEVGIEAAKSELEWNEIENLVTDPPERFDGTWEGNGGWYHPSLLIFQAIDPEFARDNPEAVTDFWVERVGLFSIPSSEDFCRGFVEGVLEAYEMISPQLS